MPYPDDPRAALAQWVAGGWEHGRARAPEWAAAVLAQWDAAEEAAFRAAADADLARSCLACFEGVCEVCIAQRGTGGDGQPCRCDHAGWYAAGLRRYGAHHPGCELEQIGTYVEGQPGICTCGWAAVKEALDDG